MASDHIPSQHPDFLGIRHGDVVTTTRHKGGCIQQALAKERRELREQQRNQLLDSIPKDLAGVATPTAPV